MPENIGTARQPLVGGKVVSPETQEEFGLITFLDSELCSASLLRNNWAICAAHCVEFMDATGRPVPDPTRPGQNTLKPLANMTVTADWNNPQSQQVVRVITFRPYDVALLELGGPFTVNGASTGYNRLVFDGHFPYFGALPGAQLLIFGRGIYKFASGEGDAAIPSAFDVNYRIGYAKVSRDDDHLYWYPSENGQIAGGDSGGPSFAWVLAGYALVGVHAATHATYVEGKEEVGWDWVTSVPEAADAPITPLYDEIYRIMGPPPPADGMGEPYPPTGDVGTFDRLPPDYAPIWIYGLRPNGELLWFRKDSHAAAWDGPRSVATRWTGLKDVIAAGGNSFYALTRDNALIWHQHEGFNTGAAEWKGGNEVGLSWNLKRVMAGGFERIFSGGDGVFYAIREDGKLFWLRHLGFRTGSNTWAQPKEVGSNWSQFRDVFSLGKGAVYAVKPDGTLLLYQQKGFETGERNWYKPRTVGSAWHHFQQIIPVGDGVILTIRYDGRLTWYKHLGLHRDVAFGPFKDRWAAPATIGSGWQDFAKVVALMPTDDPVR